MEQTPENLEELAEVAHDIWSHWMKYMIDNKMYFNPETSEYETDYKDVERWARQIETPYEELTEEEKESDRTIAYEYLSKYFVDKR